MTLDPLQARRDLRRLLANGLLTVMDEIRDERGQRKQRHAG